MADPVFHGIFEFRGNLAFFNEPRHDIRDLLAAGLGAQMHAKSVFGVVFKKGIGPSRTMASGILRVRHARCGTAPDGGAARSVGNHHAVTKELGYELGVRRFTAAGAGAGKFKKRPFKVYLFMGFFFGVTSSMK